MKPNKPDIKADPKLSDLILTVCKKNREIIALGLCTTDGFNIKSFARKPLEIEADKLAAMSSSLFALSSSSAIELTKSKPNITTIEADQGNILFLSAEYGQRACVVTMVSSTGMSLGQARFEIKRFSESLNSKM